MSPSLKTHPSHTDCEGEKSQGRFPATEITAERISSERISAELARAPVHASGACFRKFPTTTFNAHEASRRQHPYRRPRRPEAPSLPSIPGLRETSAVERGLCDIHALTAKISSYANKCGVMKSKQRFDPTASSHILDALLAAIDARCFADAPSIPEVIDRETIGDFNSKTTSSGQALESTPFSSPPIHIPNAGSGSNARHSYKSELSLVRNTETGTKKLLWWHAADPRSIPHNHPWAFRSAILSGGYTEERFSVDEGKIVRELIEYSAGAVNLVPANVFHNVIEVKPDTVTFLDCGPARPGNEWGYLDPTDGTYFDWKQQSPDNFLDLFKQLNAH